MSKSIMKFETLSFTAKDKIRMINLCYHIPVKNINAICELCSMHSIEISITVMVTILNILVFGILPVLFLCGYHHLTIIVTGLSVGVLRLNACN